MPPEEHLYPTALLKWIIKKEEVKESLFPIKHIKVLVQLFVNQKQDIQEWREIPIEEDEKL